MTRKSHSAVVAVLAATIAALYFASIEEAHAALQEEVVLVATSGGVATVAPSTKGVVVHYPKLARMRGQSGTVVVEVQPSGAARVLTSSGVSYLDAAALSGVRKASLHTALTGLQVLQVPVQFVLVSK